MTAIAASSVRVKTMADGTLQITVAVEPRHATDAFKLLGMPGTPVALAALKVGTPLPEPEDKPKGGPLAKWAAIRATDPRFQEWLDVHSEEAATRRIRVICGIVSRAELDNDPIAERIFKQQFMEPWSAYCAQHGMTE